MFDCYLAVAHAAHMSKRRLKDVLNPLDILRPFYAAWESAECGHLIDQSRAKISSRPDWSIRNYFIPRIQFSNAPPMRCCACARCAPRVCARRAPDERSEEVARQSSRKRLIESSLYSLRYQLGNCREKVARLKREMRPEALYPRNLVFRADIGAKMTFDYAHAPTTSPVPGLGRRQLSPRRVTKEPPEREAS